MNARRRKIDRGKRAFLSLLWQKPWLESLLLAHGAGEVTSLEYHEISSEHPKVSAVTPWRLADRYLSGTLEPFDLVASFSSIEHSGLGRYGDQLNPWGDLIAMARWEKKLHTTNVQ